MIHLATASASFSNRSSSASAASSSDRITLRATWRLGAYLSGLVHDPMPPGPARQDLIAFLLPSPLDTGVFGVALDRAGEGERIPTVGQSVVGSGLGRTLRVPRPIDGAVVPGPDMQCAVSGPSPKTSSTTA